MNVHPSCKSHCVVSVFKDVLATGRKPQQTARRFSMLKLFIMLDKYTCNKFELYPLSAVAGSMAR